MNVDNEKSRAEFEAVYAEKALAPGCCSEVFARGNGDGYALIHIDLAWRWWKESRAALVVELPVALEIPASEEEDDMEMEVFEEYETISGAQNCILGEVRVALRAAGITVKEGV